ncbi:MAG: cobalamin-independent methionine synthase II family protein [Nitrospirae bacterium]|nr:cobalamin-independent methionine synthase II family protein [Nitrospirota bacterium]
MPLLTTTIGSYPKPAYVPTPDWFRARKLNLPDPTVAYDEFARSKPSDLERLLEQGTHEVVEDQMNAGIDIPTDGEVRRDNYIYYHCRELEGIDFSRLTKKVMRAGTWEAKVPTIVGPIAPRDHFLPRDWQAAQSATDRPVKITLPGPLTIADTVADAYYQDERLLGAALADAINHEIQALAEAGCTWIQVDEPVFAREAEKALAFGIENLERCFHGTPPSVTRGMHMCCGYPDVVDNEAYPKADPIAYFSLAPALDESSIQAVSIEDAHRHNDLSLLEHFTNTQVIFGVIAIARSRVEPVEEISSRLAQALEHIDAQRLIAAPDCGLGMLDRETAVAKMSNLATAAHALG